VGAFCSRPANTINVMRTEKIGRNVVEIYDSIDELPIKRFHKFNKYLLVDSGIGSDLNDINRHIGRISKYIGKDNDSARRELENLRQSLYMVSEGTNVRHLSFAVLVKSINGVPLHDLSDQGIRKTMEKLSEVKQGFLSRLIESVKKKIDQELSLYFPGTFDNSEVKEYYDRLRERALLQLDQIIRGTKNESRIEKVDDFLLILAKPEIFAGSKSKEISFDKEFESMCLFLTKELAIDIEDMNVMQFYSALEYIKKQRK